MNPNRGFEPSRFQSRSESDDRIPIDRVISLRKSRARGFCLIPLETMSFYPVEARVLNMLAYLSRMKPADKPGGWYRITAGRSVEFLLQSKDSRRRALAALEARGAIEVERQVGKSPYIRFRPEVAGAFLGRQEGV